MLDNRIIDNSTETTNKYLTTFLIFLFYVFSILIGVTDKQFLLAGDTVVFPIFNVSLDFIPFFFFVSPTIFFLHFNFVLHLYKHSKKVKGNNDVDDLNLKLSPNFINFVLFKKKTDVFIPSLIFTFIFILILPFLLLLWVQIFFLKYHSIWISSWHFGILLCDILLILYYWRKMFDKSKTRNVLAYVLGAVFFILSLIGLGQLVFMDKEINYLGMKSFPLFLDLNGEVIIGSYTEYEKLKQYNLVANDTINYDATIKIENRDLRFANFSGATLVNISFNNSKLVGANFIFSNIKNIFFIQADLSDADFSQNRNMKSINFRETTLNKTNFSASVMEDIDFRETNLSEIEIIDEIKSSNRVYFSKKTKCSSEIRLKLNPID